MSVHPYRLFMVGPARGDDFRSRLEKYMGEVRLQRFEIGRLAAEADIAVGTDHTQACTPSAIAMM